jgi:hypothetical protein
MEGGEQTMLLAEALRERADAKRQLTKLRDRIAASARHTEGEEPIEDAATLLAEASALIDRQAQRIAAINAANLATVLPDGRTLTRALADRDALRNRFALLTGAADAAGGDRSGGSWLRLGRQELRTFPTLDVTDLRRQADAIAQEIRALDITIERLNVTTELG